MISAKIQQALNEQITLEFESSFLYLSMAAYFEAQGLSGMAQWMRIQADEERGHALRLFDHLRDRGGRIILQGLNQPKTDWASPQAVFEEAYQHEQFITSKINDLVKLAASESDPATGVTLQWFVTEQIEEEASTSRIAQQLKMVGASGSGLVMLDRQLGKRSE